MKLLVVAYKFGTEEELGRHLGTYHYFIEMMRRLAASGHEVLVAAPWLSFFKKGSIDVGGVKVCRYYPPLWNSRKLFFLSRPLRLWYFWATRKTVLKLDRAVKYDAILVWQARETGFAVAKICDRLRAPFMFRQITAWQWHLSRPAAKIPFLEWVLDRKNQRRFAKTIYEKAAKILFVSRAAAEAERPLGVVAKKVAVWSVGIEADLFAPRDDKLLWKKQLGIRGEQVLLFIGRINFAEKGIGYLLQAMPDIIAKFPDVNLVIIGGGGESERMKALIEKLGIREHVQLVGLKPFEKLPEYLNAVDALIVPSTWVEHFGQVTIEAMAAGLPVITTSLGGGPEINLHNQTGLVVPPADAKTLAQAAVKLLSDEALRHRLGQAGRQRVLQNYTYEVLIDELADIIQSVKIKGL